jgi:hypothetical protein
LEAADGAKRTMVRRKLSIRLPFTRDAMKCSTDRFALDFLAVFSCLGLHYFDAFAPAKGSRKKAKEK